jgi:hypothetical protein
MTLYGNPQNSAGVLFPAGKAWGRVSGNLNLHGMNSVATEIAGKVPAHWPPTITRGECVILSVYAGIRVKVMTNESAGSGSIRNKREATDARA